ncbi:MAG: hypothetical protein M0Z66_06880 [Thermaerobacter sp.]|nr:hypothetical protein [Thermaerobacter sp.]
MMPLAAFFATGVLVVAAILGVPLVSLIAGVAAGLFLASYALPFSVAVLLIALVAEFLAIRVAPPRDPTLAQAGALVVLGRILGAAAGAGTWMAAVSGGIDPSLAMRDLEARGLRALGVLLVLALFAAAS